MTETSLGINRTTASSRKSVKWVRVQIWGKRGEALAPRLKKGSPLVFQSNPEAKCVMNKTCRGGSSHSTLMNFDDQNR